ncbi:hypothetical protein RZS08_37015, partial [Arthrospira platensis SPKY1]|nr:hypothetical protein [Arthrospira platensis SPKY1]
MQQQGHRLMRTDRVHDGGHRLAHAVDRHRPWRTRQVVAWQGKPDAAVAIAQGHHGFLPQRGTVRPSVQHDQGRPLPFHRHRDTVNFQRLRHGVLCCST